MKSPKLSVKNIFQSKLFLVGAAVILILISISFTKEIVRRIQINQEIARLQSEVSDLEERNAELANVIQYLNSSNWQEKEARTKLNLKAPGEEVVVTHHQLENANQLSKNIIINQPNSSVSNIEKWWDYFVN